MPWFHIGGEGPERIFAGYYLAGYDIGIPKTQLDIRGEILVQSIFSLIVRVCDAFHVSVGISAHLVLYSLLFLNLTAILIAYFLGSYLFNDTIGLYFSLLLGSSYQFWYFSNQTRIETPCATLMLASVYAFLKTLDKDSNWLWFILWGLLSAFAFETTYFAGLLPVFYVLYILLSGSY